MNDWPIVTLGDVADEVTVGHVGPMAMHYQESGVPFLRSQNVVQHAVDLNDIKFISPEFHATLTKSRLRPGDVITVRTGKPGTTSVVPEFLSDANCSDLVITRPGTSLNARWLSYYMNSAGSHFINSQLVGAVQQHFNVGSAKSMTFPLPSLLEQEAIGEVLGAFDDKIAANTKIAATADGWVRACLAGITASAEETVPVSELVVNRKELAEPSTLDPASNYLGLEHLPRRSMWASSSGTAESVTSTKAKFQHGDILFGKLRPYFHKVVVAPYDGVCSTDILVLNPSNRELAGYTLASLASDFVVERATAASEGTRMPRTSWKDLASIEVRWPGLTEAKEFSARVAAVRSSVESLLTENRTLASVRDALLPQLMSGRLRVKNAEAVLEKAGV
ncbi:restriction endonuclease subunit S [Arthrobacter sp. CC3]|uniref:restriction endonuclease subunit S n=1 Tax=Arthrobacter sp. CC3 TaxID=3029185 RepID=UPI0032644A51